jgi:hypothetical protein
MKKYIKLIKKAILKEVGNDRTIKTLDIGFSIDGAENPVIKVKLKTVPNLKNNNWTEDDYEDDGGCQ